VILQSNRCAEHCHDVVTGELAQRSAVTLHPAVERSSRSDMISRSRSAPPTAAAISMEHGAISMAEWTGARLADVLEAAGLHHDEDLHVAFAAPTWLRKLGRSSNVGTK